MPNTRKNFSLTEEQKQDARAAIRALEGRNITLLECATAFLALGGRTSSPSLSMLTEDAIDEFLRESLTRKLRQQSIRFYSQNLSQFAERFPDTHLDEITTENLMLWLGKKSTHSALAHKRAISALYNQGKSKLPPWCSTNPAQHLPIAAPLFDRKIKFLTVAQAEKIMAQSPREYTAALALMLFVGVRPEEIRGVGKPPLSWEHIDLDERSITIPADISKTRVTRVIQNGVPENVWEWLLAAPQKIGDITPASASWLRHVAKSAACPHGEPWPHDATRHSFGTYYVAAFGDIAAAIEIIGHGESLSTFRRHYHGAAKKEQGRAYFNIYPNGYLEKKRNAKTDTNLRVADEQGVRKVSSNKKTIQKSEKNVIEKIYKNLRKADEQGVGKVLSEKKIKRTNTKNTLKK